LNIKPFFRGKENEGELILRLTTKEINFSFGVVFHRGNLKRPLRRPTRDNITMDPKKRRVEGGQWVHVVQDRD
jgi:hypothetical protein